MSSIKSIPPGTYFIISVLPDHHDDDIVAERLTREGEKVILHPPSTIIPVEDQEWQVSHGGHGSGNILIERPFIRPTFYLTYKGAPDKPKEGAPIVDHPAPHPLNEWHPIPEPGNRYLLHVAGSELGIRVGHHDPENRLELGGEHQLLWKFIPVIRD